MEWKYGINFGLSRIDIIFTWREVKRFSRNIHLLLIAFLLNVKSEETSCFRYSEVNYSFLERAHGIQLNIISNSGNFHFVKLMTENVLSLVSDRSTYPHHLHIFRTNLTKNLSEMLKFKYFVACLVIGIVDINLAVLRVLLEIEFLLKREIFCFCMQSELSVL